MAAASSAFDDQLEPDEFFLTWQRKWNLTILSRLKGSTKRFTQLMREIGAISQKTLTSGLRSLERDGFVCRTSYPTIPPRVDYTLTPLGTEALEAFEVIDTFASRNGVRVVQARQQFDTRATNPGYAPTRSPAGHYGQADHA